MDAFISYRRKPSASLALLLQAKLKAEHKIDAYVDTTRADGATVQFPERLMQAIVDKQVFICLLGDTTLESEWVHKEIEQAYNIRKRCVPVFQENYVPPENPSEAVKYLLNFDGVHVFDVKNVFVDESVTQIARLVKGKKKAFNPLPAVFGMVVVLALLISAFLLAPMLQANPPDEATDVVLAPTETRVTNTPTDEPTVTPTYISTIDRTLTAIDYNNRGNSAYRAENYELAIEEYNHAIELDSDYATLYSNRGDAYYRLGRYEEALADYEMADELGHDFGNLSQSRYDELRVRVTPNLTDEPSAATNTPSDEPTLSASQHNTRGIAAYEAENNELAIQEYNRAIELDPDYAAAYANRGLAYLDLDNYEAALADYDRAIELNPKYAPVYIVRGNAYYSLRDYEAALADYNRGIELSPDVALYYYNRGNAYYLLDLYEEALADYQMAEELGYNFDSIAQSRYDGLSATVTPNP